MPNITKLPDATEGKLYHVVRINEKTGNKTYLTFYPVSHREACTFLSKQSTPYYSWARDQLEECK